MHVFLATIVLQELWAGARAPDQRAYAERLYETARGARRLLNPPAAAWILSGRTLRILDSRRGLSGARLWALRNDVLLAATAFVYGTAVMTSIPRTSSGSPRCCRCGWWCLPRYET
jgi:predicted nucleic acid-binding protein